MTARRMLFGVIGSFAVRRLLGAFNGQSGDGEYKIGEAECDELGNWTENPSNPTVTKSGTDWASSHVKDPWLMPGGLVMYVSGYNGTEYQIGRLTRASLTDPWVFDDDTTPTIGLGGPGDPDEADVAFPTIVDTEIAGPKRFWCWYRGRDGAGLETICVAYSADGESWTKVGRVIDVGAPGSWNDVGVAPGAVVYEAGLFYLLAAGRQGTTNPRWQGGLWVCTDPEDPDTYVVEAGNPIILARFNDANTTSTVTGSATITAGSTTVPVPVPSAFHVGEPVILVDGVGAVDPEIFYLTAIGGSDVTLDRPTTATFQGASVLRSFAYNSMVPRSVLPRPDGYLLFAVPFQALVDLTIPGNKLREGSFEMEADALDGPWTYRYRAGRGLLFPLDTGDAWHSRSAENLSVIVAPG